MCLCRCAGQGEFGSEPAHVIRCKVWEFRGSVRQPSCIDASMLPAKPTWLSPRCCTPGNLTSRDRRQMWEIHRLNPLVHQCLRHPVQEDAIPAIIALPAAPPVRKPARSERSPHFLARAALSLAHMGNASQTAWPNAPSDGWSIQIDGGERDQHVVPPLPNAVLELSWGLRQFTPPPPQKGGPEMPLSPDSNLGAIPA